MDGATPNEVVLTNMGGIDFRIKRGTTSNSLAAPMVRTEQVESIFIVDVEVIFPCELKEKVFVSTSTTTSSPLFPLYCYAHATHAALAPLKATLDFDHLHKFQFYLEEEDGGFHHDQIQLSQPSLVSFHYIDRYYF